MSSRIKVISRMSGRRRWTVEQKLAVLQDALGPDGSIRTAVERHDVGSGSIYIGRRQAMSGEVAGDRKLAEPAFAEVRIGEPPLLPAPIAPLVPGLIGIDLPSGIKVTVDAAADINALSRVIGALTR